jgi:hypothetical protein
VSSARPGRVIVAGAGPTGLTLAGDLALAGVDCLVLERRPGLRTDSRAICLHARSMEMLDLRGLAQTFARTGLPVPSFPLGLRGAAIGLRRLDSDFPYLLDLPQGEIEALLAARAERAGAQIAWSRQVTAVEQDDSGVWVTLADGEIARGAYLVACDGIRSFVRESLGIPFPGIHNPGSVILADLTLDGLDDAYGDLSRHGMLLVFPLRGGSCRVVLYDYSRAQAPVVEPVTLDEVAASLVRVVGRDFRPRDKNGTPWDPPCSSSPGGSSGSTPPRPCPAGQCAGWRSGRLPRCHSFSPGLPRAIRASRSGIRPGPAPINWRGRGCLVARSPWRTGRSPGCTSFSATGGSYCSTVTAPMIFRPLSAPSATAPVPSGCPLPCWSGRTGTWPGRLVKVIRRGASRRPGGRSRTGAAGTTARTRPARHLARGGCDR